MAKFFILALLTSVAALSAASKVEFQDCGSKEGKIIELDISPCPEQPCVLVKGTKVNVSVAFDLNNEDVSEAKSSVHGIIARIPIPFPLPNSDACKDCGLNCPLEKGSKYMYTNSLDVKSEYPSLKLVVKWELKDTAGNDIFCFQIPVQIKSP